MEIVKEHFPERIRYTWVRDNYTTEPDVRGTLRDSLLCLAIGRRLDFQRDDYKFLNIGYVLNKEGKMVHAITVGSNYEGILKQPWLTRAQELFAPGDNGQWHLDRREWYWTRDGPVFTEDDCPADTTTTESGP
ncbi:hypothetical protein K488DRAFT_86482 [Vararia minispora EC-137]|uniref:Uncharacterized protein n=1 Tax=Vararia minispora EC-137 TaxID=1314806 RepID=A0ACB8QJP6_9AGAM|nr:hypothetical protein K488DRAFT_86482 [Vararia minispora EC-137]